MQWKQTQNYGDTFCYLIYQEKIENLEGYIFENKIPLNFLWWTSGFRAIDDLPRAHWVETGFSHFAYDNFVPAC